MNELPKKKEKRQLPAIEELYKDSDLAIQESELQVLLNQKPDEKWIKEHPFVRKEVINDEGKIVKVPYKYIPINILQWLMKRIFGGYLREIKEIQLIANSVTVSVRIHYRNILTGEMEYQDGVGAVALQTDKDAGATDFNSIKSSAVMMAAPAAATYAEKDAIGCIGKLFGSDINRKDDIIYISNRERFEKNEMNKLSKELGELIHHCQDKELSDKIAGEAMDATADGTATIEMYKAWIALFK